MRHRDYPAQQRSYRKHTARLRRSRFSTQWSVLNARLGGVAWVEHPNLRLIERYDKVAPYYAPSREWAKFMKWFNTAYREVWNNGGSSWSPR